MPTRIAFCITELDVGGAEKTLVNLARHLDRAEWEPRVYCLGPWAPLVALLHDDGVPVECFNAIHVWDTPRVLWQLRSALAAFQPAILQSFLFHANILGRIAGAAAGVPHRLSGIRVAERRSAVYGVVDFCTNFLVEKNVCVSRGVADYCEQEVGLSPQKTVVIPNGVELSTFAHATPVRWSDVALPDDAVVWLTIARLEPQKGLTDLLDAAALVHRNHPETWFVIVGDGPDRIALEEQARTQPGGERIRFLGRRDDVPQLLRGATGLVLSSRWEGMPNVVLEAMAAGKPVVATEVEGTAELIAEGESGLRVPVSNSPALGAAIERLSSAPDLVASMGRRAQQIVSESFTTDAMAEKYLALYRELMAGAPAEAS
ncbi:MAG TPA: glycosyltransferase [Planctomycetaceae bacterium]|nr:glycosyltransferase [Planctomycetaceae bacterium]